MYNAIYICLSVYLSIYLSIYLACVVAEGDTGTGKNQGTCPNGNVCHIDGSCSACSVDTGTGVSADPHTGCTPLNPTCAVNATDPIMTECRCGHATICDASSDTCDSAAGGGAGNCSCGEEICGGTVPVCVSGNCRTCSSGAGGGSSQADCPNSRICQSDGSCVGMK